VSLPPTPSQTIGPFFALPGAGALPWPDGPYVVAEGTPGAFRLHGRVLDGAGEPVPDGLVESWQADPDGRFPHPDDPHGGAARPGFRGFGRCATDPDGRFWLLTVKPGTVPAPDGRPQAPHLDLSVFARGLNQRLVTRVYFADEPAANAADPVLASLPAPARATLLAAPAGGGYRFDVHLQGEHETAFFDV
jgi:protocatechuate 3,4-dioxygenase, alpha subunit